MTGVTMWFRKPNPNDLSSLKKTLNKLALQVARENFGVKLDYSIDSVKQVETILGKLHDDYNQTRSQDGLRGIALEFGAYIISVIERNFEPGVWHRDHSEMGSDTFPYEWRGASLFPYGWCLKRLTEGPEDDVWAKFQALVVQSGSSG